MSPLVHLPLAFFTNPLMLGWLAAASAPLIIHLWNKRKHREVAWAAIDFLLAAMRKNSRRIQLEQWILLAIRTLIIALLVLAVAEPFLEQTGLKFIAGQRTHKVLVLDGSFSMAYKPTDKSRFDRAKELAAQIVDESSQGDGFTLVLMGSPPRVVVGTPAFERGDFVEEIENLKLPHGEADLPATVERVEEILKRAGNEYPRLVQNEVYFLSDLGRHGWLPEFNGPAAQGEFRERSKRLAAQSRLVVLDLGQTGSDNLAVTSVAAKEAYVTVGRDAVVTAEVKNFGRNARSQQLAEFFIDGRRAGEDYVDLDAGGQASLSFNYRFDSAGEHAVEVRLAADQLDIDNHRFLALPVKEKMRVLCVDGKPSGSEFGGAADYLAVALSPQGIDGGYVEAEVAPERAILEADLTSYDCVFLCNVEQFTKAEAQVLQAYLQHGGGLVFFLGDQVRADSYNEQLFGPDDAPANERVLPARLEAVVAESQYRFAPGDYRHPIIKAFRGQDRAGLLTTPIYKYFKLKLPENGAAQIALALENGDPAIVEERLGRGRSIVVATSADPSWNTMPIWPSYLPIVQQLLAAAVSGAQGEHNLEVGQPLGSSVRTSASDAKLELRPPQGEVRPLKLVNEGDYSHWTFADTDYSGMYVAQFGPPISRNDSYAVNVNTLESDLTKLELAELRSDDVWPGVNFEYQTNWQNLDEPPAGDISRRAALHKWLLYAALALMLAETLLAWQFGRRNR